MKGIVPGRESPPSRAVVQSGGRGFRVNAQILKDDFDRAGPVARLLLRYTQALITQMSQTAVCNRHHSVDQQLCRWLGLEQRVCECYAVVKVECDRLLPVQFAE